MFGPGLIWTQVYWDPGHGDLGTWDPGSGTSGPGNPGTLGHGSWFREQMGRINKDLSKLIKM